MTDDSKVQDAGTADKVKLAVAILIVIAGVVGYYVLANQATWMRWLAVIAGLVLAGVVVAFSRYGSEFRRFVELARIELRKVVWPTRQETLQTTVVVFIFVAVAHLDNLFRRHEDLAKALAEAGALDALLERLGHAMLEIRVGVHDVPSQRHVQPPVPVRVFVSQANARSSTQKKNPAIATKANTTAVVLSVSSRVGHVTLRSSMRASSRKRRNSLP